MEFAYHSTKNLTSKIPVFHNYNHTSMFNRFIKLSKAAGCSTKSCLSYCCASTRVHYPLYSHGIYYPFCRVGVQVHKTLWDTSTPLNKILSVSKGFQSKIVSQSQRRFCKNKQTNKRKTVSLLLCCKAYFQSQMIHQKVN